MKKRICILLSLTLVLAFALSAGLAWAHGEKQPDKTGILLVAFGTSVPEAQASFKNIDAKVKEAFPGVEVRWAYTSRIIRDKLAKEGQFIDSPAVALARMADEGFTRVAVQSLHTIPGEEYDYLVETARAFAGLPKGLKNVLVGRPLLSIPDDLEKAADAMIANFPKARKVNEAVVLMGHGTPHPGNSMYPAMQYVFSKKDANVFVGTVEGQPSLDDVVTQLKARGIKKAWLIPFMSVAGDHAHNDMAGSEDDSWKSVLTEAGIDCETVLKGTAEYDNMAALWVDHLKQIMDHIE